MQTTKTTKTIFTSLISFRRAVVDADLDRVKQCIEQEDVDADFMDGWALKYAVEKKDAALIDYLFSVTKLLISSASAQLSSWAAREGRVDILQSRMFSIQYLWEALLSACQSGQLEVVKYLLSIDIDPSSRGKMVLHSACEYGQTEVVKLLLTVMKATDQALVMACDKGHSAVVEVLLQSPDVDPCYDDSYALIVACDRGHTDVVRLLLQDGRADPSTRHGRPLLEACEEGHLEVVKLLLQDSRVDPTYDECLALTIACCHGHTEIVKLLLQYPGFSPAAQGSEPLASAVQYGYTEVVKLLLDDGRIPITMHVFTEAWKLGDDKILRLLEDSREDLWVCSLKK